MSMNNGPVNSQATCINVKRLIEEKGLKPKEIKRKLKLNSVQSIYKWYATASGKGKNIPSVDNAMMLAHVLEANLDDIYVPNDEYMRAMDEEEINGKDMVNYYD